MTAIEKIKTWLRPLRAHMDWVIAVLVLCMAVLLAAVFFHLSHGLLARVVQHRVLHAVHFAALSLEPAPIEELARPAHPSAQAFAGLQRTLARFLAADPHLRGVYLFALDGQPGGGVILAVAGRTRPGWEAGAPLPPDDHELARQHLTAVAAFPGGEWVSPEGEARWMVYAPLFSKNGRRLGLVGMDVSRELVAAYVRRLAGAVVLAWAGVALPLAFLGWWIGHWSGRQTRAKDMALQHEASERQRVESAWRATENRLQNIMSSIKDVVYSISPNFRDMFYLNPAAAKVYGRALHGPADWPRVRRTLLHPDDRRRFERAVEALLAQGISTCEYRILREEGDARWLLERAYVVYDAAGAPTQVDGVITDVTERKRAEEERLDTLDAMERQNRAMVGRENRLLELKTEVNQLLSEQGRPPRYGAPSEGA